MAILVNNPASVFAASRQANATETNISAERTATTVVSKKQSKREKRWQKRLGRLEKRLQKRLDGRFSLGFIGVVVLLIGGLFIVLGLVIPAIGILFLVIGIIIAFVGLLLMLLLSGFNVDVS